MDSSGAVLRLAKGSPKKFQIRGLEKGGTLDINPFKSDGQQNRT